jgi:hypothetical protein
MLTNGTERTDLPLQKASSRSATLDSPVRKGKRPFVHTYLAGGPAGLHPDLALYATGI